MSRNLTSNSTPSASTTLPGVIFRTSLPYPFQRKEVRRANSSRHRMNSSTPSTSKRTRRASSPRSVNSRTVMSIRISNPSVVCTVFNPLGFMPIYVHLLISCVPILGDYNYVEFISNSKSGQFFFYSHDGRYMLKTQTKEENKFLLSILPQYYEYLKQNPNSLLVRILGMYLFSSNHVLRSFCLLPPVVS